MCYKCWNTGRNVPSLLDRVSGVLMLYDQGVRTLETKIDSWKAFGKHVSKNASATNIRELEILILDLTDAKSKLLKRRNRFIEWFDHLISLDELMTPTDGNLTSQ